MKYKNDHYRALNRLMSVIVPIFFLIAGCATTPEKNSALEHARSVVTQAQADPDVEQYAKVEVYEADQALHKAENAKDPETMEHFAYMAEKDAQIAVNRAQEKKADKEIEALSKEKEKIQLEVREHELAKTQKEVEEKTREAALEKQEAAARAREAEQKSQEASAMAHEAEMAKLQAQQESAQRMQLESELAELKAKPTERGLVITLGDILFETGKARLLAGTLLSIDKLADALKKYPTRNVLIEGHTDSRGGESYNLRLSERRADAVRLALIERGITADRITTKGYGKMYPVTSNSNEAGRQQNRRVEIVILNEGESPEKALR